MNRIIVTVNRTIIIVLCLMLCLASTAVPTASAASRLSTSSRTALTSCLQQEYLMRDTYQFLFAKYTALTTFGTVAVDENSMIATLSKMFAKYKIAVPADSKVSAARTMASTVTSVLNADTVAISLEQSTALLITRLLPSADNQDVANVIAVIKTTSLGSHISAFTAEQTSGPTPASTTRPFPVPVTTHTVTVPASIDAAGSSDVSTALINFIRSVPDGSLINFPSAAIYRIDRAITLENRHNLILEGNGCTIEYTSDTGASEGYSMWQDLGGCSDIWVHNFILIGSNTSPGVLTEGKQWQQGFEIRSSRVEFSGCTISKVWGDLAELATGAVDVWIHDNHVIDAGRNGVSVCSGINVLVEHNAFDVIGHTTLDIEPFQNTQSCINIIFRNNTVGTFVGNFVSVWGNQAIGGTFDNIVVEGNTVTGASLRTAITTNLGERITRITFTNNTGTVAIAAWQVLSLLYIDGLTVFGNVQPHTNALADIENCTGVITS